MLQRLGRWLITAGYDTEIVRDSENDYEVLQQARAEDRVLLTCDHDLVQYRNADEHVVLLESGSIDELAEQVTSKCNLNWHFKPFSRCLKCNLELTLATVEQKANVPLDIRPESSDVYYCPGCKQVFWDGGHVRRMRAQLDKWYKAYNQSS